MEVHGPLYPDFLLHALKLFDQHFASPSRLSFSILPRVKELGLASYVLGINIPFYNSLMKIYWERYGDANAVISLLKEMRHAGVFFDETALSIVDSIRKFQQKAASGAKGQWREALMTMPEFEPVVEMRAKHWSNVFRKSISKFEKNLAV
ncbi:hypothetical protein UCRPA7_3469 [Phaeoacremonium minimum UCRPA7]|uniref:Mtf2-like C-terminal domain-containing protein n=1 Tax=Phaeoacremonium minimum (strain UCR-PA7) TaxID=1286976 RepID=R8BNW2_PHAM7|nr:hypothetical protein UCRPA7_3469 [Phaeoacremonium minimum UCRPA7]EOO01036.1 hypothetical protein UCRPA7_3469 [Phaeoacremonium minimum UCRPA7]